MADAWLAEAERLTKGAERARAEGDTVASLALAIGAAQCLQIARLFSRHEAPVDHD